MDGLILLAVLLVGVAIVLPIVAIVRTGRIRNLEMRLAGVEAALRRVMAEREPEREPESPPVAPERVEPPPAAVEVAAPPRGESLEALIGRKWAGWAAILLIFAAASFFLKYAFENRWIGELGRVAIGVAAGLALVWGGLERYRKGWRYLSQVLTGGGVAILYLSVYGAFAYYHLVEARAAFLALVILVAEAHLLSLAYNARAIAAMALSGGFLVPVLLSTGRDQYAVLFSYILLLDSGVLALVLVRQWRWIGSLAYLATQGLFWAWYAEHYHPAKEAAVVMFQLVVLLLFLAADFAPRLRGRVTHWEEWCRLAVNPFVFYGTCYFLLDDEHHGWMAPLALAMAIVYAGLARLDLTLRPYDARLLYIAIGTALTFVTLAIPVQLESNWITIGWSLEALMLVWASLEARTPPLRLLAWTVFAGAVVRLLFVDTPWEHRMPFTPVFNRYFLGLLVLAGCLGGAGYLARSLRVSLTAGLMAAGVFWLGSSFEAYTYFSARAQALPANNYEEVRQLRWAGQLALSLLWSVMAGLLTAIGFRFDLRAARVAGLALFGLTLAKVVFIDISELQQFYRILALLALGVVLLVVAWKYQRGLRREQSR